MPSTVQHTAVRLMLNLVEVLVARSKATADRAAIEQHRQLLQQMLVTHLAKLSTLERQVPKLMAAGACSACALCANTLNSIFSKLLAVGCPTFTSREAVSSHSGRHTNVVGDLHAL